MELDRDGKVLREVAPAQFALSLAEQSGQSLLLSVALIRDWRKRVPVPSSKDDKPHRWDTDLDQETQWQWLLGHFEATPAPVSPTQPKLIPVVSTAHCMTPLELTAIYRQRWVAQENILRDFLLPLGLDINHGYAKVPVENSEVARRRAKLQKQLDRARRQAEQALRKQDWNAKHGDKLWKAAKAFADEQYRQLNLQLSSPAGSQATSTGGTFKVGIHAQIFISDVPVNHLAGLPGRMVFEFIRQNSAT